MNRKNISASDFINIKNSMQIHSKTNSIFLKGVRGKVEMMERSIFDNPYTGKTIWKKDNITTLAAAEFMSSAAFDLGTDTSYVTPSYNTKLNLDNTVYSVSPETEYKVLLFCVGTSGCGTLDSEVYDTNYKKWIAPADMVPFQFVPFSNDLSSSDQTIYFGKKSDATTNFYSYYFKKFDANPTRLRQYTDGTPIDSTIYDDTSDKAVETVVTLGMSIDGSECRDYFKNTTGLSISDARFNTLSLCYAWAKIINGVTVYQDIRPFTRINFPNCALSDEQRAWDFIYKVYF